MRVPLHDRHRCVDREAEQPGRVAFGVRGGGSGRDQVGQPARASVQRREEHDGGGHGRGPPGDDEPPQADHHKRIAPGQQAGGRPGRVRRGRLMGDGRFGRGHGYRHYPGSAVLSLPPRLTRLNPRNPLSGGPRAARPATTDRVRYRGGNGHERHGGRRRRPTWALLACALTAACSGCGLLSGGAAAPATAPATTGHAGHVTSHPSSAPSCPDQVFSRMSEAQRVGQLFLVGIAGDPISEVAQAVGTYHFGSLLFTGDSTAGVAEIAGTTSAVQSLASSAATAPGPLLHRCQPGRWPGPAAAGTGLRGHPVGPGPGAAAALRAAAAGRDLGP